MGRRAIPPTAAALGRRVAHARRAGGLSQAALGRAVSLDRTAISKIESGRRDVSSLELARIARTLRRPLESFVSEDQPPSEDPAVLLHDNRRAIKGLAAKHGVRSIRVFGSVARGDAQRDSDVDLLVDFKPGRSIFDQAALLVELRELLGRDVDVVTPEGLRDRIRERVLREAVPL